MAKKQLTDREAKIILLRWPGRTKTVWPSPTGKGFWIRAQPQAGKATGPRLRSPGAKMFSTQPDGLWAYFGQKYCDLVAVEICGTVQNLNDKRSRYFPSSHSLVLECTKAWLLESMTVQKKGLKPRWQACGTFKKEPKGDHAFPVRHLRILYALPNALYSDWRDNHVPTGYEYFCPHSSLDSYNSPAMQRFLRQMSIASQFYLR